MLAMEKDPSWQFLRLSREKMLHEQSKPYDSKKNVWIVDAEDGYAPAEIVAATGDSVTILVKGTEKTVKKELVQEMNPPKFEKTEDMSNLTFLNDASVLHNLRARYGAMLIYTYSGLFCVVINPYKRLPIYTESVARMFMGKRRSEMPPHLFAVSDEAYRSMLQNRENQSMLITGESGAGKTENTKKVIAYFASVGASQLEKSNEATKAVTLEDQIVQTNPVLEAFGNAKTVRNNNSSRFGKFIRIHFNTAGRVASCDIEHYLLEKSRVIRQAPGERCYHIFYQIFSDYNPTLKSTLKLTKPLKEYWFVAQAELTIDGVDDKEEFKLTDEAFNVLNFSADEKIDCYKLMSGIMHMGNMKFKQRPREEQAEPDETEEARCAADMFSIDADALINALVKPRVRVGNEWVFKGQNVEQVNWAIGAMAKALFARVFDWLVKKCNMTLDQKGLSRDYFIGVLDIAGFEIFDLNSFEQLWINFVNEKLQQFFNHHMFVLEQEEYAREGIQWTFIDFGLDLQACIELIEKPMGIISMLDEECIVPKATDLTLAQKLNEQHLGKHPNFEKPKPPKGKQAEAHFAMRHYAGTVCYNVLNWLEKNKDPLNDTLVSVMKSAKGNALLLEVWLNYQTQEEAVGSGKAAITGKKKGKSGSFMTVSMLYRESLNKLMSMLNGTHPHFIRCIIPNEKKASGVIDAALVLNQLTCNGVLEGIRICRKGFPNRLPHSDFKTRYSILAADAARSSPDVTVAVKALLAALVAAKDLQEEQFRVGHTKIFFKAGVLASIEELRDKRQAILMTGLQAAARQYLAAKDALRRRRALDAYGILQRNIRTWCTLRTWNWYLLYGKVKPMFRLNKREEEMERLKAELATLETELATEQSQRAAAEAEHAAAVAERDALLEELEKIRAGGSASEAELAALASTKQELERRLNDAKDRLAEQEQKADEAQRQVRRAEKERDADEEQVAQLDDALTRVEEERRAVDTRIREMNEAIIAQDEAIATANREKKRFDEENRKLSESLQAETERNTQSGRAKAKLERAIEDVESALERERRYRAEADKARKRLDYEVLAVHEQIDEIQKLKAEAEAAGHRIDEELRDALARLDDHSGVGTKQQRQLSDNADKLTELEEELEAERHARAKADKARGVLQTQLDALNDAIDEAGCKTTELVEAGKKKDIELARLRQDLQTCNQQMKTELAALKKRYADEAAELGERLDILMATNSKSSKELEAARRALDDALVQATDETKARAERERYLRASEAQLAELQAKCDEQYKLVQELTATNSQSQMHTVELEQRVAEFEERLTQTSKAKALAETQLEDARQTLYEERQERQEINGTLKGLEHEVEQCREAIDEEALQKEDILKQISRAKAEAQQWKAKFDGEGLISVGELEEERRRRQAKRTEIEDALAATLLKIAHCEKSNAKLMADEEEARADTERSRLLIAQLEQRQAVHEKAVAEWRKQCDELVAEIERVEADSRRQSTAVHTLQTALTALTERADELRRENKALVAELRDTREQLTTSIRIAHDSAKKVKMLEMEKEEIQHALDEAESALEIEEGKVLRVQSEVTQIRADIDRRIAEKEEDFESTVKNHQRAIESIRVSLNGELKGRAQLAQQKQTLENDLNNIELSLDMANKGNIEAQKQLKKYQMQIQDLQAQVEEEQRRREEFREQFLTAEHQLTVINAERQELEAQRVQLDVQRAHTDAELAQQRAVHTELQAQNVAYAGDRRAAENDVNLTKAELDKTLSELRQAEDQLKKVNADVDRLAGELSQEQQHHEYVERLRRNHELQLKELQVRLEQSEQLAARHGQRAIDKLQETIRSREQELEIEQRRHKDVLKQLSKCERDVRERSFELEEHKKSSAKMQELIDKLQSKLKVHKKQVEEAEEVAMMNQQKFRQIQTTLENTEERADEAENSLMREKSRMRQTSITATNGGGLARLAHSVTAVGGLRGMAGSAAAASAAADSGSNSLSTPAAVSGIFQRSSSTIFAARSRLPPRISSYARFK